MSKKDIKRAEKLFRAFTGHSPRVVARVNRPQQSRVAIAAGVVTGIIYLAERDGETVEYLHRFKQGSRPLLLASPDGKVLELLGGAFRFTARGIVDK